MINSGKLYSLSSNALSTLCIDYYELLEKNTYQVRQSRIEFRALFFGPEMTDYWLIYLDDSKKSEAIETFLNNPEAKSYKTLKQCAGWSLLFTNEFIQNISELKALNRQLYDNIGSEIAIETH